MLFYGQTKHQPTARAFSYNNANHQIASANIELHEHRDRDLSIGTFSWASEP